MTAINVVLEENTAHIFSDTKANIDGYFVANVAKVCPIPRLNIAIATRGSIMVLPFFVRMAALCSSFADFRKMLGDLKRMPMLFNKDPIDREVWKDYFDVFVVGVIDGQPVGLMVFNHGKHGFAPWIVHDIGEVGGVIVTPTPPPEVTNGVADHASTIRKIPEFMSHQHRLRPDIVGGFIEHTAVTAEGITQRCMGKLPEPKRGN